MAARKPRALVPVVEDDSPQWTSPTWGRHEREEMTEGFGRAIAQVARELRDGLSRRIANVESRCALLEDIKSNCRWAGTWNEHLHVRSGELVTCGGSLFLCVADTVPGDRPGRSSSYKLIVKSGRVPH